MGSPKLTGHSQAGPCCLEAKALCGPDLTESSFFCLQTMGDVKLVASSHVPKTSLSVGPSKIGSAPLMEAPAFILPPRNLCVKEGATAKFEGRVRSVAEREACRGLGSAITPSGSFSSAAQKS